MVDENYLKTLDEQTILRLYSVLMEELRDKGLIRTSNNPVADYAEKVAVERLLKRLFLKTDGNGCEKF